MDSSTALLAFEHDAIDRNFFAGADAEPVADLHLFERDVFSRLPSALSRRAVLGLRSRRARMAALVLAAGAQLQNLAEQDQRGDHGGGFEVDVGIAAHERATMREKSAARAWRPRCSRRRRPCRVPISVNMFGLRLTSEVQTRWKNGHPPQSTTGVASSELDPRQTNEQTVDVKVETDISGHARSWAPSPLRAAAR